MRKLNDTENEILYKKEKRKNCFSTNIKEIEYLTIAPRQTLCIVKNDTLTGYGISMRMMSDYPNNEIGHNLSFVRAVNHIILQISNINTLKAYRIGTFEIPQIA